MKMTKVNSHGNEGFGINEKDRRARQFLEGLILNFNIPTNMDGTPITPKVGSSK